MRLNPLSRFSFANKYDAEVTFWQGMVKDSIAWYKGEKKELFGTASPTPKQKIKANNEKDSALLTWLDLHQKPKYKQDLELSTQSFANCKLLDIGAGPLPSATIFAKADLYCLDPLYSQYLAAGYPLHYYENTKFINGYSENIPVQDSFFDAVISVNAIDHVDDLTKTSAEIKRVLKKDGKFAMHVHYHKATKTEPLELNDAIFKDIFGWCKGLAKAGESRSKMGWVLPEGEVYVLWKNFDY